MNDHSLKQEIMKEIQAVYDTLPETFYAWVLSNRVCSYVKAIHGKAVYQDTVLRYFRALREKGVIDCECVNRRDSLYRKGGVE